MASLEILTLLHAISNGKDQRTHQQNLISSFAIHSMQSITAKVATGNFKLGPVVQEEMLFKGISYLELWQPFYSVEQHHLCNFGRGVYEEQFCEIILNLGQWFSRCCLKDFLSEALVALLIGGAEPFMQF